MSRLRRLYEDHREAEIQLARATLTDFMLTRAEQTAAEVGFSWLPTADAPNEFAALQAAYAVSARTGVPLPVSGEHNDDVVYTSAAGNIAFRFVHDVHHVTLDLSFEVVDELELALWHLQEFERAGFLPPSLPWRMLHADLIGQAHLIVLARNFPENRRRFVRNCLLGGFERGLVEEARQIRATRAEV